MICPHCHGYFRGKGGKPSSLTRAQKAEIVAQRKQGVPIKVLAHQYRRDPSTISRVMRLWREGML